MPEQGGSGLIEVLMEMLRVVDHLLIEGGDEVGFDDPLQCLPFMPLHLLAEDVFPMGLVQAEHREGLQDPVKGLLHLVLDLFVSLVRDRHLKLGIG